MLRRFNIFYSGIIFGFIATFIYGYNAEILPIFTALFCVFMFSLFLLEGAYKKNLKEGIFVYLSFGLWSVLYFSVLLLNQSYDGAIFKNAVILILSLCAVLFSVTMIKFIFSRDFEVNYLQSINNLMTTSFILFIWFYLVFLPKEIELYGESKFFIYIFLVTHSVFASAILTFMHRENERKYRKSSGLLLILSLISYLLATLIFFRRFYFSLLLHNMDYILYAVFAFLFILSLKDIFSKEKVIPNISINLTFDKTYSSHFSSNILLFSFLFLISTALLLSGNISKNSYYILLGLLVLNLTTNLIFSYGYFNEKIVEKQKEENTNLELYVIEQIEDLRRINEELKTRVHYDSSTGLFNLASLYSKINELIERNEEKFSVVSINVDDFKTFNNVYGHHVGDQFLLEIANRLKKEFSEDSVFVYRVDGDEFAVLFMDNSFKEVERISARILSNMGTVFPIDGKNFFLEYSTSVVRYPLDAKNVEEIVQGLSVAMIESKKLKNNKQTVYFSTLLIKNMKKKMQFENFLRNVRLDRDFSIHIHQYYDVKNEEVSAIRPELVWNNAEFSEFKDSVDQYIESIGILDKILSWFVDKLLEVFSREFADGFTIKKIVLRINNSPNAVIKNIPSIQKKLDMYQVPISKFDFEISSSFLGSLFKSHLSILKRLNNSGVGLVIRDFGIGYSSLNILKKCKVKRIIISEALITNIDMDTKDLLVFKSVINIAKGLRIEILVEGLERLSQYIAVKDLDCDFVSGNFIAEPLEIESFFDEFREKFK